MRNKRLSLSLMAALAMLGAAAGARAQTPAPSADAKPTLEIYGFGQADAIVDFNQVNPQWFDVMRPSRLPAFNDEQIHQLVRYVGSLCDPAVDACTPIPSVDTERAIAAFLGSSATT